MNKTTKENKKPNANKKEKEDKSQSKSKEKDKDKGATKKDEKKAKKEKKDKDKEKNAKDKTIKKPLGPYILFGMEMRPKLQKDNPNLKAKEIMSLMGEQWKKLSDSEKKKYHDLAEKDKERYERECAEAGVNPKGKKKKATSKTEKVKKGKKTEESSEDESD